MTKIRRTLFKTKTDAKTYLQGYQPQFVTDPRKDELQIFRLKQPRGGYKYFVGTLFELDVLRFS